MAIHKNFDSLKLKLNSKFKLAESPLYMSRYADKAAQLVKNRTRLGYGVPSEGAEREKLLPLKRSESPSGGPSYVSIRQRLKEKGELSGNTSPGKSNLTNTGQMLDSIKVTKVSQGRALIDLTGTRDDGLTNKKVGEFVSAKRPFFHLSNLELKQIALLFEDVLRKILQSLD